MEVPIDDAIRIDDSECKRVVQYPKEEGLFCGGSTGINVAAAVALAKQPGHTIVTILCDSGARYQSRLFNREWEQQKNFYLPNQQPGTISAENENS